MKIKKIYVILVMSINITAAFGQVYPFLVDAGSNKASKELSAEYEKLTNHEKLIKDKLKELANLYESRLQEATGNTAGTTDIKVLMEERLESLLLRVKYLYDLNLKFGFKMTTIDEVSENISTLEDVARSVVSIRDQYVNNLSANGSLGEKSIAYLNYSKILNEIHKKIDPIEIQTYSVIELTRF